MDTNDKNDSTNTANSQPRRRRPFVESLLMWLRPRKPYNHNNQRQNSSYFSISAWFWFWLESIAAWTIIVWFSCCYLIDYIQILYRMRGGVTEDRQKKLCSQVPLTTLARTKTRAAISTEQRLDHLTRILQLKTAEKQLQQRNNQERATYVNSSNSLSEFSNRTTPVRNGSPEQEQGRQLQQPLTQQQRTFSTTPLSLQRNATPSLATEIPVTSPLPNKQLPSTSISTPKEAPSASWEDSMTDPSLVEILRTNLLARHLASLIMAHPPEQQCHNRQQHHEQEQQHNLKDLKAKGLEHRHLIEKLKRVWAAVLEFPPLPPVITNKPQIQLGNAKDEKESQLPNLPSYPYEISLIIPAFRERAGIVEATLQHALEQCDKPEKVQVLIVDAGGCVGLSKMVQAMQLLPHDEQPPEQEETQHQSSPPSSASSFFSPRRWWWGRWHSQELPVSLIPSNENGTCHRQRHFWGQIQVLHNPSGGGRGGSLNFGALHGRGKIFTFLHSDTLLPKKWDSMIQTALLQQEYPQQQQQQQQQVKGSSIKPITRIPHACAFSMGIDISPDRGLQGTPCPPGLVGVASVLGWIRCRLCHLPYGDSVLSLPAVYFHHLGGYPDQPLMEDYELVTLLRKRSFVLPETMVILPAQALCSPRRWQKFGVCYTLLVNALCIHRYKRGATAEDLYDFYYHQQEKEVTSKNKQN